MQSAAIAGIAYYLPAQVLTNEELATQFSEWSAEKIEEKTGIRERHVAGPEECVSDLAVAACERLFRRGICTPAEIDYLLLCTQSPDYPLPTTACLVQDRLGLQTDCGALDFNLGCSGFVYGLGLAKSLIETGQAANVLLVTAETYTKYIHPWDKSVRTIFGDAAAATVVRAAHSDNPALGPFVYGTDGRGAKNLIVSAGGTRNLHHPNAEDGEDDAADGRTVNHLYMNGPEIFNFTLKTVPRLVFNLLAKAEIGMSDIDLFVLHQANRYMLEHLQRKMNIPKEKLPVVMAHCGNTVSSTIPILLSELEQQGRLRRGQRLMILGFGVGYSWAGAIARW